MIALHQHVNTPKKISTTPITSKTVIFDQQAAKELLGL